MHLSSHAAKFLTCYYAENRSHRVLSSLHGLCATLFPTDSRLKQLFAFICKTRDQDEIRLFRRLKEPTCRTPAVKDAKWFLRKTCIVAATSVCSGDGFRVYDRRQPIRLRLNVRSYLIEFENFSDIPYTRVYKYLCWRIISDRASTMKS